MDGEEPKMNRKELSEQKYKQLFGTGVPAAYVPTLIFRKS